MKFEDLFQTSVLPVEDGFRFLFGIRKFAEAQDPPDTSGVLEGQFTIPTPQAVALMSELVQNEFKTLYAYTVFGQSFRDLSRDSVAEHFQDHAGDELEHAEWLLRRMSVLGGPIQVPDIPPPPATTNPVEIIKIMIRMEQEGIAGWKRLLAISGDNPQKIVIEDYMAKEQEHLDELWQLLPQDVRAALMQPTKVAMGLGEAPFDTERAILAGIKPSTIERDPSVAPYYPPSKPLLSPRPSRGVLHLGDMEGLYNNDHYLRSIGRHPAQLGGQVDAAPSTDDMRKIQAHLATARNTMQPTAAGNHPSGVAANTAATAATVRVIPRPVAPAPATGGGFIQRLMGRIKTAAPVGPMRARQITMPQMEEAIENYYGGSDASPEELAMLAGEARNNMLTEFQGRADRANFAQEHPILSRLRSPQAIGAGVGGLMGGLAGNAMINNATPGQRLALALGVPAATTAMGALLAPGAQHYANEAQEYGAAASSLGDQDVAQVMHHLLRSRAAEEEHARQLSLAHASAPKTHQHNYNNNYNEVKTGSSSLIGRAAGLVVSNKQLQKKELPPATHGTGPEATKHVGPGRVGKVVREDEDSKRFSKKMAAAFRKMADSNVTGDPTPAESYNASQEVAANTPQMVPSAGLSPETTSYLNAEMAMQLEQAQAEAQHYQELAQGHAEAAGQAQQQAGELQNQVQDLSQQLQQAVEQAQAATDQAGQVQQQAMQSSQLAHSMAAQAQMNQIQATNEMVRARQESANTQSSSIQMRQRVLDAIQAGPEDLGVAQPPPNPMDQQGQPQQGQPQEQGASNPPKEGKSEKKEAGLRDAMGRASELGASYLKEQKANMFDLKKSPLLWMGVPGVAAGGVAAGTFLHGLGHHADGMQEKIDKMEEENDGSFGAAVDLAKAKMMLSISQAAEEHPIRGAMMAGSAGFGLGTAAGALGRDAYPEITRLGGFLASKFRK